MAQRKKDPEPGDDGRNGAEHPNGTSEARAGGRERGRSGPGTRARRAAKGAGPGDAGFQGELRAAREQALREVREGYERLGKELTAATGRLAESIRHAQEQLADLVRQAHEARRDVEELRQLARDTHREGLGEPTADRAGAAKGSRGARRGRQPEPRNRFGVTVGSGVVVAEVLPDSPATAAGLKRGDVIEEVNGAEIVSATQLRDAVRAVGDAADVKIRIVRAGDAREVRAKVVAAGEAGGDEGRNQLGVTVGPGVVVAEVLPDTAAATAGLERGDVIEDVNGTAVLSGEQFRQVVQQLPAGVDAVVRVTRAGQVREVRARLNGAGG